MEIQETTQQTLSRSLFPPNDNALKFIASNEVKHLSLSKQHAAIEFILLVRIGSMQRPTAISPCIHRSNMTDIFTAV